MLSGYYFSGTVVLNHTLVKVSSAATGQVPTYSPCWGGLCLASLVWGVKKSIRGNLVKIQWVKVALNLFLEDSFRRERRGKTVSGAKLVPQTSFFLLACHLGKRGCYMPSGPGGCAPDWQRCFLWGKEWRGLGSGGEGVRGDFWLIGEDLLFLERTFFFFFYE